MINDVIASIKEAPLKKRPMLLIAWVGGFICFLSVMIYLIKH